MNLYFVASTDLNGESTDLFVTASTPEGAVELWRKYYEGWDLDEKDVRVFPVPAMKKFQTAHDWAEPLLDTRK